MSMKEEPSDHVRVGPDREKADLIRDRLMKWTGFIIENAEQVHLVMNINGKDVCYECAWLKPLLKKEKP